MTTQNVFAFLLLLFFGGAMAGHEGGLRQLREYPSMPQAVTNNAVVSVKTHDNEYLISFAGLGKGRMSACWRADDLGASAIEFLDTPDSE